VTIGKERPMNRNITTADPLLTVTEVVTYLGSTVSATTVRRLIQRGELRPVRIAGAVRVRVSAVEEFLNRLEP
jgi:excisionase family DNA binding protein